ncbi:MAG: glutamate-5-semialdehyde dehydrogenase [candidate division WS1 bacterium]|jgi:glutamate-5-semialdehyde dehydrogenase|nr:glutamate-5-semialdehyde dehydrogenase [candidate division WS1 bacterium]
MSVQQQVTHAASSARRASRTLASISAEQRADALRAMAQALRDHSAGIIAANANDMKAGSEAGLSAAMLDRLMLDDERVEKIAVALEEIADLPDPVGDVLAEWTIDNGLLIQRVSVPIGVIGIIYESRPNVTADAAGLCIKSGNACVLRGGSEAIHSNLAIAAVLQDAAEAAGLPAGCISIVPVTDRDAVGVMCRLPEYIDMIIPRGGEGLIRAVTENAQVPVLKHYRGMTQIYVDEAADRDRAVTLVHNAKVQRPGVCNAVENLYVHSGAPGVLNAIVSDLLAAGVEVRGCPRTVEMVDAEIVAATDEDFDTEYLDLILAVKVVDSLDEALEQIAEHTSGLAEAIITEDQEAADRFLREVDSAAVYHNASTRLTDGGVFGLGAEIGVSTDKIHARGPVGAAQLTIFKYVCRGDGQIRS